MHPITNLAVSDVGELGAAHNRGKFLGREVVDADLESCVFELRVVEGVWVLDSRCNVLRADGTNIDTAIS